MKMLIGGSLGELGLEELALCLPMGGGSIRPESLRRFDERGRLSDLVLLEERCRLTLLLRRMPLRSIPCFRECLFREERFEPFSRRPTRP